MHIIFPILLFFINTSDFQKTEAKNHTIDTTKNISIYLIKQRWHTGIVLKKSNINNSILPEAKDFPNADYLDIGWGDKEFYLHNGFDYELAYKALFYPTPTVLRIEEINTIENFLRYTDTAFEIKISKNSFDRLCLYIAESFKKNKNNNSELITERNNGEIKYYNAEGSYSLFNTCNTWLARGLKFADFNIDDNVIITEQIFNEMLKYSKVIKN